MGKYKNKCLINFQLLEVVEYLQELGYTQEGGLDHNWALAIMTEPETTTYKCLNSNEIVKLSSLPKEQKPKFCYSMDEFKALVSEPDPDYVEPEAEEPVTETEPEPVQEAEPVLEAPAPKKKTTRKKTTKTTETND